MISLKHSVKELMSHKTRLLLTIFAIAWGTIAISCMLAIGQGLRTTFSHATRSLGEPTLTILPGVTTKPYHGNGVGVAVKLIAADVHLLKSQVHGIDKILAIDRTLIKLNYRENSTSASVMAVTANYIDTDPVTIAKGGRFFTPLDEKLKSRVIVLGQNYVDRLFKAHTNPVGQTIQLGTQAFTVIGVMPKTKGFVLGGMPNYYRNYIPLSTYRLLSNTQDYNKIVIVPKHGVDRDLLSKQIRRVIAFQHQVNPLDPGIISIRDHSQIQNTFNNFMLGLQIFLGLIGFITLVVAGVGVANVMFASINQATRDIGIRIAIGAKQYHIVLHYAFESLLVTFIGGILGVLLSFAIVVGLQHVHIHSKYLEQFGNIHPILSYGVVAIVIGMLGLIGFFAGFFPAKHAAQIDPVEALRNE